MDKKPDTITLSDNEELLMTADAASMTVEVSCNHYFSGEDSFKKAKEVSELTGTIEQYGVEPDSINVRDVHVESTGFVGIKSTSCQYTLHIKEVPAKLIAVVMAQISSHKQSTLLGLEWCFTHLEEEKEKLRLKTIEKSLFRAKVTAEALGVSVLGIYQYSESYMLPTESKMSVMCDQSFGMKSKRSKLSEAEVEFSLIHTSLLRVSVNAEYRISGISS